MSRKIHHAPKPYEIKCCAVQIKLEEKYLKEFDSADNPSKESMDHLFTPSRIAEKIEGFVGLTVKVPYLYVLFEFEKQAKALDYYAEIKDKYETKLVRNSVFADKRYLNGEFKNKMVSLPPDYVDEAIRKMLNTYCFDYHIEDNVVEDLLEYVGNLGGREVRVIIGGGDKLIVAGLKNGNAVISKNVCGDYKRVLKTLEKIIVEWRESHSGIAKKI